MDAVLSTFHTLYTALLVLGVLSAVIVAALAAWAALLVRRAVSILRDHHTALRTPGAGLDAAAAALAVLAARTPLARIPRQHTREDR